VVNCNITSRGAINHVGGCMNAGGACIGCTMPGFPDKFTPFHTPPPGSTVSTMASRLLGTFIRPLRMFSNEHLNREARWDIHHHTPSGFSSEHAEPGLVRELGHRFYDQLRRSTDTAKHAGEVWGSRSQWTETKDPTRETHPRGSDKAPVGPDGASSGDGRPADREVSRRG
jgi:hydrogenase small subunit